MEKVPERVAERRRLVDRLTNTLAPRMRNRALANWELATEGSAASAERVTEAAIALDRVLADGETYLAVRRFVTEGATEDAAIDRSLVRFEKLMAPRQGDAAAREELVAKEAALRQAYGTFRGTIAGKAHSATELERILRDSNDVKLRADAWAASKQVGEEVREQVIEIVELRNGIARGLGYRDHYAMSLELQELSEEKLFATLNKLEKATRTPFRTRKAVHDAELARRFGVSANDIQPWHYVNPFFQSVEAPGSLKLDEHLKSHDLEELTLRFFDGIGMNVRSIMAKSDLYPREGKDQHAFCTFIDARAGETDIRVLANVHNSERWMGTMLHEFGHAAYNRYIEQPWVLCAPAHTLMTEAIAQLMGRQSVDLEFLLEYLELPAFEVTPLSGEIRRFQCFRMQTFTRWVLVMTHFERELYADPRRADLDELWWELKSKFQLVNKPEGRTGADWAAKRHLALTPVYYQNYIYGEMVASQLRSKILERARTNSIVDSLFAGEFLIQEVFRHGASVRWDELLRRATGEELNPQHFVREFTA